MAQPTEAPIGTGMAKMSADKIMARKEYNKHVLSAQENGEEPLPFEDWMKQRMADQKAGYNQAKE